jgi:NAD(P)-dependent dehydrogenase (short-subunit alcohol dehydrogenase family)
MVFNMTEDDFDVVVLVHLKGHFNLMRWASAYFREEAKKGEIVPRHVVNTTSLAGLIGNIGQTNYAAAKGGIAMMTRV